ncbi:hypothetical protein L9F63_021769, partial [Diploptera punctata]
GNTTNTDTAVSNKTIQVVLLGRSAVSTWILDLWVRSVFRLISLLPLGYKSLTFLINVLLLALFLFGLHFLLILGVKKNM